jgi:dTDP-4-amino-4,6-dideoxygalactose transaminase
MSTYKGKALGRIGHIGTYSFHETKNYTSGGEGGVIFINDDKYLDHAEIIREKGTNRNQFFRGQVDKYTWVELGSSYLPSELQAAYLYAQLLDADKINNYRLNAWDFYYTNLKHLEEASLLALPFIPKDCQHNAHMFYLKTKNITQRTALINYLKDHGILSVFHYVPLHSSTAGLKFGIFDGDDEFTTQESECILRLPMYYNITKKDQQKVIDYVIKFYQ